VASATSDPMSAAHPLPLSSQFINPEDYVESLLSFTTSSELFQTLCGGVHVLDFLTKEPDFYSSILPLKWREWFLLHDVSLILDLLMREDAVVIESLRASSDDSTLAVKDSTVFDWENEPCPPSSLLDYIQIIRKHALNQDFKSHNRTVNGKPDGPVSRQNPLPRHVAVGMKPKKVHEVQNFAQYIHDLVEDIDASHSHKITHLVDFGSGQNYLGRALASPPYNKRVIALESKQLNITGAKSMDVTAGLADKEKIMRNKKQYRMDPRPSRLNPRILNGTSTTDDYSGSNGDAQYQEPKAFGNADGGSTNIQYIETFIESGDLSKVVNKVQPKPSIREGSRIISEHELIVISLHSCGNLIHHGLRSLILNPSVKAVAMVGCCYNLVTERLGPPTYKLPSLRVPNRRLDKTSSACDARGFPMSDRLAKYRHSNGEGIRMNITARMMACQAPQNWTAMDCESFFTRHFYRALLQRILLDRGLVGRPEAAENEEVGGSPQGWTGAGAALTIGSMRKSCYVSFKAYVRGAIAKLTEDKERGADIKRGMETLTDDEIETYEEKYKGKKKELSIVWSLMAFSASVVESTIVVDRWQYLKEQPEVEVCWVEAVFEYKQSPRNLVVVGIKK